MLTVRGLANALPYSTPADVQRGVEATAAFLEGPWWNRSQRTPCFFKIEIDMRDAPCFHFAARDAAHGADLPATGLYTRMRLSAGVRPDTTAPWLQVLPLPARAMRPSPTAGSMAALNAIVTPPFSWGALLSTEGIYTVSGPNAVPRSPATVTMVTQMSVSRLSRLLAMSENWSGPISVVVYGRKNGRGGGDAGAALTRWLGSDPRFDRIPPF